VASLFQSSDGQSNGKVLGEVTGGNGELESFTAWLHDTLHCDIPPKEIAGLDREELEQRLCSVVEDLYRPEMRRMERALLLEIVDTAWKDHLLAMDHLKSSITMAGYAQLDPKVEYKREGMRMFQQMWRSIGGRVTDLIFRMESLDEDFVGSNWVETSAHHEEAQSQIAQQQQSAIEASQGELRIDPIRNREERVGRNSPCPCGSGKKYKNCCLRRQGMAG
jgi:preprotein translocase subunit SecA